MHELHIVRAQPVRVGEGDRAGHIRGLSDFLFRRGSGQGSGDGGSVIDTFDFEGNHQFDDKSGRIRDLEFDGVRTVIIVIGVIGVVEGALRGQASVGRHLADAERRRTHTVQVV